MKKYFSILFLLFLLSACAAPTPKPPVGDVPFNIPTDTFSTPQVYVVPTTTPTEIPVSLDGVKFLSEFSDKKEDWQVISGNITAAQVNAAVAGQVENKVDRVEQKVINGFLRTTVKEVNGQVFEVLYPAEMVNGKLKALKVKNVGQVPVLASQALLLADYFAVNFPDVVSKWEAQGAQVADFKYAAIITITWATKYGPLNISYKMSGKYISETGKHPGQLDFLRLCMYEQTKEHFLPNSRLGLNWFPVPIVGLSGTAFDGTTGKMESDAFGWTPMTDFAGAESDILNEIAQVVSGTAIESKEVLAVLQAAFDKAFMPVYCTEAMIK